MSTLAKQIILFMVILLIIGVVHKRYVKYHYVPQPSENNIESYAFPWDEKDNLMQGKDMCGAYVFVAIQKLFGFEPTDPKKLFHAFSWMSLGQGILPFHLESISSHQGLTIKTPSREDMSTTGKIEVLQNELQQGHPIILIVKANGPHYILLLGYNKTNDEFYVYDSFLDRDPSQVLTKNTNGDLPGNATISSEQLLERRSKGGKFGLYNYYALIIGRSEQS